MTERRAPTPADPRPPVENRPAGPPVERQQVDREPVVANRPQVDKQVVGNRPAPRPGPAAPQQPAPAPAAPAPQQAAPQQAAAATPLLGGPDLEAVNRRWHEIQAGFVDAPQQAVHDADALVGDLMNRLAQMFAAERRQLETHWSQGDQVSTEDLRLALQKYRSFFQRLLSVH